MSYLKKVKGKLDAENKAFWENGKLNIYFSSTRKHTILPVCRCSFCYESIILNFHYLQNHLAINVKHLKAMQNATDLQPYLIRHV